MRHVKGASTVAAVLGAASLSLPDLFIAFVPWAMATTWTTLALRDRFDLRMHASGGQLRALHAKLAATEVVLCATDLEPLTAAERSGIAPPSLEALRQHVLARYNIRAQHGSDEL
jgi:hypothetical protein